MPEYMYRNFGEFDVCLQCPFCGNDYKTKSGIISHAKHCNDNPDTELSLDNIIVWKSASALDMIKWQAEVPKLVKELINSSELAIIQTHTPEQIREDIRTRMRLRTANNYIEECDIYNIYEFFFGLTETDIKNRSDEFNDRMWKSLFVEDPFDI